ncbi:MAG TPA: zinc ribbon domain-containing protein [Firmicutes bacterium]|nr:zinc ribbon domain-containing protein [Bacillota bacterium]
MPIFEFRCSCGRTFEKLCRSDEGVAPACPGCGSAAQKIFSSFSVGRSTTAAGCMAGGSPPSGCSGCSFAGHHH